MTTDSNAQLHDATEQSLQLLQLFAHRLGLLMDRAGISAPQPARVKEICARFSVSSQTARKWLGGEAIPSPMALVSIADHFSEQGATVDWMLGRGPEGVSISTLHIPVLVSTHTGIPSPDEFQIVGEFSWHPNQGTAFDLASWAARTILINWSESIDPPFRAGDPLVIDPCVQGLPEEDIFLVRTSNLTSIRRVRKGLDGTVTLIRETSSGKDAITINPDQVVFSKSKMLDEIPNQNQFMIMGRVVGHGRRLRHNA